jgi:ABC-2 type transport system permease protein
MWNRIRCLLIKEAAQIRRDKRLFGILLIAPVIQLFLLGFAATTDVREITLGVRDNDHTSCSREYVRALESSGYFRTVYLAGAERQDDRELVDGRAGLVLVIPAGFGASLTQSHPATVQALTDGADSNFAVQGLNYLQKATRLYSERLVRVALRDLRNRHGLTLPGVRMETRAWFNPDLTSTYFMVPGIVGVLLLVTTMVVTSMALVKEREDGTMEQLIVTPVHPFEIIAGKLLPFVVIGFAEVTLALPVMFLVFHVPLRGSLFLLYAFSGLFLLTTLGLGLFVSTLVKTQQQAMLVAAFFVAMPFILLSGFIFPIENMPAAIRPIAQLIPLKHYLVIVRGIFLKGVGLTDTWQPALVLLVWGIGILSLAVFKFRQRLD